MHPNFPTNTKDPHIGDSVVMSLHSLCGLCSLVSNDTSIVSQRPGVCLLRDEKANSSDGIDRRDNLLEVIGKALDLVSDDILLDQATCAWSRTENGPTQRGRAPRRSRDHAQ